MDSWKIGNVKITKLQEQELAWKGTMILREGTADNVKREGEWLQPFVDNQGKFLVSVHSLLIESEGRRILVDTCVGNDKNRPGFKDWTNLHLPFLATIDKAGFPRHSIDTVICTHLHLDHVGWNTVLENGRWVPTFPKAKYLMTKLEWEHWSKFEGNPDFKNAIDDSVRPVVDAGQAELVETSRKLTGEVGWNRPPVTPPAMPACAFRQAAKTP